MHWRLANALSEHWRLANALFQTDSQKIMLSEHWRAGQCSIPNRFAKNYAVGFR